MSNLPNGFRAIVDGIREVDLTGLALKASPENSSVLVSTYSAATMLNDHL